MEYQCFDNDKIDLWINFVKKHKRNYTLADNPELPSIIESIFGWKGRAILVYEQEELIALCSFNEVNGKLVSLPHFSYGCLILKDSERRGRVVEFLMEVFGLKFYEIRDFKGLTNTDQPSEKVASVLFLKPDVEEQIKAFKSKLRSQIRKGYKNNLTTKIGAKELLKDFYKVYSKNMHNLGSPVLPMKFFSEIVNSYSNGRAVVFITYYNEIPVGAAIVLNFLEFSEVCWASTLREYNKLSTNMHLYWEMIAESVKRGDLVFSFGRSTKGAGTHRFKKQWGTEERELFFNKNFETKKEALKKLELASKVWSMLPKSIVDRVGPIISKRIY